MTAREHIKLAQGFLKLVSKDYDPAAESASDTEFLTLAVKHVKAAQKAA